MEDASFYLWHCWRWPARPRSQRTPRDSARDRRRWRRNPPGRPQHRRAALHDETAIIKAALSGFSQKIGRPIDKAAADRKTQALNEPCRMKRRKGRKWLVLIHRDKLKRLVMEDTSQEIAYAFPYEVVADVSVQGCYEADFHFSLSS